MNTEDHDDLWELLGRARQPEVSPFFARNVLREVRGLTQERNGFLARLRAAWKVPALAGGACAVLAAGFLLQLQHRQAQFAAVAREQQQQMLALARTVSDSPDYLVIAHLDELVDAEESSVWLPHDTF